jgi:phosphatidylinositol alpha-1,6-mannosyltransferase
MSRPEVLVVTRNHPPLTGGMERLLQHTVAALAERHAVTVIGPAGGAGFCPSTVRYIGCPANAPLFLCCALLKGLMLCSRYRPAVVFGGSGLVAPISALLGRIAGARRLIYVHGLDLVVDNGIYQRLFVPFIRRHDLVLANSENTRRLAIGKGCAASRVQVLHPGATMPARDLPQRHEGLAGRHGLEGRTVVLFVGRMIRRKGLAPFIEQAWPRVRAAQPDAVLVVVGDSPDDALRRDRDGGREIEQAVEAAEPGSIVFLGAVDDDTLDDCYAMAACLVFPLIPVSGDVEGFGMVAIEAAARGTPTVAFAEGGVGDAVREGESGSLVTPGDYEEFARQVVRHARGEGPSAAQCRTYSERFGWPRYARALDAIVSKIIEPATDSGRA